MRRNPENLVVVTGGGRGIGKIISKTLLENGYDVHAISSDLANLEAAERDFAKLPGTFTCSQVDLRHEKQVLDFCDAFDRPIYGIVNNAATNSPKAIDDYSVSRGSALLAFKRVLAVNAMAPYILCMSLLPQLLRPGRIINIASQLGYVGRAKYGAYCASKAALIALTRVWAKELGGQKITVNAVCPSWVETELHQEKLQYYAKNLELPTSEAEAYISRNLELKRFSSMPEVASVVLFLLSDDAAGITGQSWKMSAIYSHE